MQGEKDVEFGLILHFYLSQPMRNYDYDGEQYDLFRFCSSLICLSLLTNYYFLSSLENYDKDGEFHFTMVSISMNKYHPV